MFKRSTHASTGSKVVVAAMPAAAPQARTGTMEMFRKPLTLSLVAAALLAACASSPEDKKKNMSFFVTSAGPGNGADLGGLAGADRHCQSLAAAAGAGGKTWRAYLSTTPVAGAPAVHARDRIGRGPWANVNGVVIASDVDQLHGTNGLSKQTALTESGAVVNGRGDTPNTHDILTGSSTDGRAVVTDKDTTCGNWTLSGDGAALLGHHDRMGLNEEPPAKSWNSSHPSRGCSPQALKASGGNGLFYCFAAN